MVNDMTHFGESILVDLLVFVPLIFAFFAPLKPFVEDALIVSTMLLVIIRVIQAIRILFRKKK